MEVIASLLVKQFESLPDQRHEQNRRHLLVDVIVISVCGVLGVSGRSPRRSSPRKGTTCWR